MKIAFVLMFFAVALQSNSQALENSCPFLENLLNANQVKSTFFLEKSNDTLALIDKNKWFAGPCNSFKWGNHYVKIVNDSSVRNKISSKDPYFIFKEDCKTYIFDGFMRKGKMYSFSILQPCSGLLTEAVIKFNNKKNVRIVSVRKLVL